MRIKKAAAVVAAAGGIIFAGAVPASAATMVCTPQSGAPSLSRSGLDYSYTYAHSCNTLAGLTDMVEVNSLEVAETPGKARGSRGEVTRHVYSTGTRFTSSFNIGEPGGYWNARMDLTIRGNFSFGSVSGCGRVDPTTVKCMWRGPQA